MFSRKKAQVQVFEQVLLFAIGVMIFLASFAAFSAYQNYYVNMGNSDQLIQVREYIAYAVFKTSELGDDIESYTTLDIPRTIGGETYVIELSENGLVITTIPSDEKSHAGLYGLNETFQFLESKVISSAGKVVLYKNGDKIIIT